MPLYIFKCPKCTQTVELISKFNETKQCACGSTLEKQVTNSNFQLKGKGWEKDGYSK